MSNDSLGWFGVALQRPWIERLREIKAARLQEATTRARLPFAVYSILGLALLAVLLVDVAGWDSVMLADLAKAEWESQSACACRVARVRRYLGVPEPVVATCQKGDADDALCRRELEKQHDLIRVQFFKNDSLEIPLVRVAISGSDAHLLGALAQLVAAFFLAAAVRREESALGELLNARKGKDGESDVVFVSITEAGFTPADFYLAQKAIAHTFVFQSSTPSPVLRIGTTGLLWMSPLVLLLTILRDAHDILKYYSGLTGLLHLVASLLLVVVLSLLCIWIWRLQARIYVTLGAFAKIAGLIRDKQRELVVSDKGGLGSLVWKDVLGERFVDAFSSPGLATESNFKLT